MTAQEATVLLVGTVLDKLLAACGLPSAREVTEALVEARWRVLECPSFVSREVVDKEIWGLPISNSPNTLLRRQT